MTSTAPPRWSTARADTAPATAEPVGAFVFLPHLLTAIWVVVVIATFDPQAGLAALSITSCVYASAIALKRGGDYLTPSGVFFLSSGVFIGVAGYYLAIVDTAVDPAVLRDASGLALLTTIAISVTVHVLSIRWHLRWPTHQGVDRRASAFHPPRHLEVKGVLLVVLSQMPLVRAILSSSAPAIGVAGIIVLVLWAGSRRIHMRWYGDAVLVALAFVLPYAWVKVSFSGGGRLLIAGIGIASFLGWNLIRPSRVEKVVLILCIPLFLAFAGLNRADSGSGDDTSAGSVVSRGDGLASVYSPLETWTRMIEPLSPEQSEMLGPRYGGTFVNTFYLPIPRSVWPNKPKGFGAELTEVFEPQLVKSEHSMAALGQGEWYANFGYYGLVLMVPVTGLFLALLDREHARLARTGLDSPRAWWRAGVVMCLVSSLGELFWVGTFSMYARGGLSAVTVWLMGRLSLRHRRGLVHGPSGGAGGGGDFELSPTARDRPGPAEWPDLAPRPGPGAAR